MIANPLARAGVGFPDADLAHVAAAARARPATPLIDATALAQRLGLARLLIKDESARWGLNAFKITGTEYALGRCLDTSAASGRITHLVCASAGNHGRAVAHAARTRGLACRVFLPVDALAARVDAIRQEGAEVVFVNSYAEALDRAAAAAREPGALLVSDAAHRGGSTDGSDIPSLIMHGYTQVFQEAARQWSAPPDVIVVQGGVGGLVGAAAGWIARALPAARLIAAEPEGSACLMASALAGEQTTLDETTPTSMVCLRCAEPSAAAWPYVAAGVEAFVTVTDAEAAAAVDTLASIGIRTQPSGACGFAALTQIAQSLTERTALVVVTEGG